MKKQIILTLLYICISGVAMNQNIIIFEDDLNTLNKDVWFGNAEIVKKSLRISDSRSDIEIHLISKPFPVERSAGYLLTFKCLPLGEAVRKAGGFLAFYDAAPVSRTGTVIAIPHKDGAVYRDIWNDKIITPEIRGKTAYIKLSLAPQDVGAIVQE